MRARDTGVQRAIAVADYLDELLCGYHRIRALNARSADAEARDLLTGFAATRWSGTRMARIDRIARASMAAVKKRGFPAVSWLNYHCY
jgi:hypothetical protein